VRDLDRIYVSIEKSGRFPSRDKIRNAKFPSDRPFIEFSKSNYTSELKNNGGPKQTLNEVIWQSYATFQKKLNICDVSGESFILDQIEAETQQKKRKDSKFPTEEIESDMALQDLSSKGEPS
jgi:hypothetical protein